MRELENPDLKKKNDAIRKHLRKKIFFHVLKVVVFLLAFFNQEFITLTKHPFVWLGYIFGLIILLSSHTTIEIYSCCQKINDL